MNTMPIDLSPGGGVMLPPEDRARTDALARALGDDPTAADYDEVAPLLARWPDFIAGWAALGDLAWANDRPVEAYAYYRVGYHRSLDRLRGSGWRGAGRVPYDHEPNRAFHHTTAGLMRVAAATGDVAEAERCRRLLLDSDPTDPLGVAQA